MAEVRAGRGWTRAELAVRLASLASLPRTSPALRLDEMRVEDGWRLERSEARIACDAAGPPRPDGAFARAREALAAYAFSDPTIVEAHFDPYAPLHGRRMLLELKVLGLHYLCGVEVTDVRDTHDAARSVFGFRYDTLAGHVERGAEWFLVEHDHATGDVRLVITSRWRRGELREWWTRVGFGLLAPSYRAMWLHRAHERLSALLRAPHEAAMPPGATMIDEGPPTAQLPALPVRARNAPSRTLAAAAALGALTGIRSLSGLAVLAARSLAAGPQPGAGWAERALARPGATALAALLELGEMIADKTSWPPPRIAPVSLAGRALLGAACGAAQARRWRGPAAAAAALAGATAVASAIAAYRLREGTAAHLRVPTAVLGAVEDLLVAAAGAGLIAALGRAEPPAYAIGRTEERRPRGRRRVVA